MHKPCSSPGCSDPLEAEGLCHKHRYRRQREASLRPGDYCPSWFTVEQRLHHIGWTERVVVPELGPCHEWNGARNPSKFNYGKINIKGDPEHYVHRLAFRLWVDPSLTGDITVRHRCDNPPCMRADHLEAGTQADNMQDMSTRGRHRYGENGSTAKLSEAHARDIIARYRAGGITQQSLADEYGVKQSLISRLVNGNRWVHLH